MQCYARKTAYFERSVLLFKQGMNRLQGNPYFLDLFHCNQTLHCFEEGVNPLSLGFLWLRGVLFEECHIAFSDRGHVAQEFVI